jgi:hypothetical protein
MQVNVFEQLSLLMKKTTSTSRSQLGAKLVLCEGLLLDTDEVERIRQLCPEGDSRVLDELHQKALAERDHPSTLSPASAARVTGISAQSVCNATRRYRERSTQVEHIMKIGGSIK